MDRTHIRQSFKTTRESDKFMLRLPDGMRERIKAAADANNRSMNAEIVATLEEKYPLEIPEVTLSELTEWVRYIEAGKSPQEIDARRKEIDTRLAKSGYSVMPGASGDSHVFILADPNGDTMFVVSPLDDSNGQTLESVNEVMAVSRKAAR